MICEKFNQLNTVEKIIFIGKVNHCVTFDDESFEIAKQMIALATLKGVFDGVTILPQTEPEIVQE